MNDDEKDKFYEELTLSFALSVFLAAIITVLFLYMN